MVNLKNVANVNKRRKKDNCPVCQSKYIQEIQGGMNITVEFLKRPYLKHCLQFWSLIFSKAKIKIEQVQRISIRIMKKMEDVKEESERAWLV